MKTLPILALLLVVGCARTPDDVVTVADLSHMGALAAEERPGFEQAHGLKPRAQIPGIIRQPGISWVDHTNAVIYVADQDDYYGLVAEWYYLPSGYTWLEDDQRDRVWRGLFLKYADACEARAKEFKRQQR